MDFLPTFSSDRLRDIQMGLIQFGDIFTALPQFQTQLLTAHTHYKEVNTIFSLQNTPP